MVSRRALVPVFVAGLVTMTLVLEPPVPLIAQPYDPGSVAPFLPGLYRLQHPPAPKIDKIIPNQVVVKYKENFLPPKNAIRQRDEKLRDLGVVLQRKFHAESISTHSDLGWVLVKLPPGLSFESVVNDLAKDEQIEYATPDYEITFHGHTTAPPADWLWTNHFDPVYLPPYPSYPYLWGLDKIGMEQAWKLSHSQGGGILIAILDGAINYLHPDLGGNYDNTIGEMSYCTYTASGNALDHGTHVAGIIAAVGGNGSFWTDPTFVVGVNRTAKFTPVRIACPAPSLANAILGINYAKSMGAAVINTSWGLYLSQSALNNLAVSKLVSDLRTAISTANMTLLVASAGNEKRNLDASPEPKIYPQMFGLNNVIVVAATDPNDALWVENYPSVSGSNFGITTVDIAAPGKNIFSVLPQSQFGTTGSPIEKYVSIADGTSAAAPFVAGCAALLQSRQLAIHRYSPFTPQQLKSILRATGDPLSAAVAGQVGSGKRLNCHHALQQVEEQGDVVPPMAPTSLRVY